MDNSERHDGSHCLAPENRIELPSNSKAWTVIGGISAAVKSLVIVLLDRLQ